jgi:hypothetical protein
MSYVSDHALYGVGAFEVPTTATVVKPTTTEMGWAFKNLQSQLNRAGKALGFPTIGVDGVIGKDTYALALKVSGWTRQSAPTSIPNLASYAMEFTEVYRIIADNAKVEVEEKKEAAAAASAPVKVTVLPGIGIKGYLPYLLAAGAIVGTLYLISRKSKKKTALAAV